MAVWWCHSGAHIHLSQAGCPPANLGTMRGRGSRAIEAHSTAPLTCSDCWCAAETAWQGLKEKGDMKVRHKAEVNQDENRQTGVGARWRDVLGCNREIQPAKDGFTHRNIILKRCGAVVWTVLKRLSKRILWRRSTTDRYEPPRIRWHVAKLESWKNQGNMSHNGWPKYKDGKERHNHTCLTRHRPQSHYKAIWLEGNRKLSSEFNPFSHLSFNPPVRGSLTLFIIQKHETSPENCIYCPLFNISVWYIHFWRTPRCRLLSKLPFCVGLSVI